MGSVAQLTFGLLISFFAYGAYMMLHPFGDEKNDRLSQLCQAQTFLALLSSIILQSLHPDGPGARNMGALLVLLMALPVVFATWIELTDKGDKKRARERTLLKMLRRFLVAPIWKWLMKKRAEIGRKQRQKEQGHRALLRARTMEQKGSRVFHVARESSRLSARTTIEDDSNRRRGLSVVSIAPGTADKVLPYTKSAP